MKKRRLKTWPIIILLIFIILIICIISIISSLNNSKKISTETIDTIKKYNYNLKQNESTYYKELFKELKSELKKDKMDEKKYASIISKMFLTDFLSLNNAINKNDVGGTDFIYSTYKDTFITKAKDTLYLYIENNIYGDRKQELPIVEEVKIINIENKKYDGEKVDDENAYYIDCEVVYKKDLDYQKKVNLILVHNKDKLEIVSMK
ncbi:MAG: hypothetical protein E7157_03910 [Lactobacillales bacterium]|nr:hypothetical protein [Lactobacillales bacterium]